MVVCAVCVLVALVWSPPAVALVTGDFSSRRRCGVLRGTRDGTSGDVASSGSGGQFGGRKGCCWKADNYLNSMTPGDDDTGPVCASETKAREMTSGGPPAVSNLWHRDWVHLLDQSLRKCSGTALLPAPRASASICSTIGSSKDLVRAKLYLVDLAGSEKASALEHNDKDGAKAYERAFTEHSNLSRPVVHDVPLSPHPGRHERGPVRVAFGGRERRLRLRRGRVE